MVTSSFRVVKVGKQEMINNALLEIKNFHMEMLK